MTVAAVNIRVDPASQAWLREFARRISVLADLVPCPADLVDRVKGIPRADLIAMFKFMATDRAGELRLLLEPSNALLELMTALRAFQGEFDLLADSRHDANSSGDKGEIVP